MYCHLKSYSCTSSGNRILPESWNLRKFPSNDWCIKIRTNLSTVSLLCMVRILMHQTLHRYVFQHSLKDVIQTVLEKAYSILLTEQLFWRSTEILSNPTFGQEIIQLQKAHRCHIYILSCFGNHYFGHFIKAKLIYKILATIFRISSLT